MGTFAVWRRFTAAPPVLGVVGGSRPVQHSLCCAKGWVCRSEPLRRCDAARGGVVGRTGAQTAGLPPAPARVAHSVRRAGEYPACSARFSGCRFECGADAGDAMDHFMFCPVVEAAARRYLGLGFGVAAHRGVCRGGTRVALHVNATLMALNRGVASRPSPRGRRCSARLRRAASRVRPVGRCGGRSVAAAASRGAARCGVNLAFPMEIQRCGIGGACLWQQRCPPQCARSAVGVGGSCAAHVSGASLARKMSLVLGSTGSCASPWASDSACLQLPLWLRPARAHKSDMCVNR